MASETPSTSSGKTPRQPKYALVYWVVNNASIVQYDIIKSSSVPNKLMLSDKYLVGNLPYKDGVHPGHIIATGCKNVLTQQIVSFLLIKCVYLQIKICLKVVENLSLWNLRIRLILR